MRSIYKVRVSEVDHKPDKLDESNVQYVNLEKITQEDVKPYEEDDTTIYAYDYECLKRKALNMECKGLK